LRRVVAQTGTDSRRCMFLKWKGEKKKEFFEGKDIEGCLIHEASVKILDQTGKKKKGPIRIFFGEKKGKKNWEQKTRLSNGRNGEQAVMQVGPTSGIGKKNGGAG